MDSQVDQVISELSKIESAACEVEEKAEQEKREYAQLISQKTKAFDEQLAKASEEELAHIREQLIAENEEGLEKWRQETNLIIEHMEQAYEENHSVWADNILEKLIEDSE